MTAGLSVTFFGLATERQVHVIDHLRPDILVDRTTETCGITLILRDPLITRGTGKLHRKPVAMIHERQTWCSDQIELGRSGKVHIRPGAETGDEPIGEMIARESIKTGIKNGEHISPRHRGLWNAIFSGKGCSGQLVPV